MMPQELIKLQICNSKIDQITKLNPPNPNSCHPKKNNQKKVTEKLKTTKIFFSACVVGCIKVNLLKKKRR
jgi:hypothetical protein